MKKIKAIEITVILVVILDLILEFAFHISIKIIPKFLIVTLCEIVLFFLTK